ncbi:hypothetical protein TVAG_489570 [Trichomonas vaginalis G3]|uniref:3'-5' exonuclease domain-containing protein n=1 Tax=Trichomonas vaginalis (strain ATCC PRA-98 / G3) TaxID=412133 RepID=A2FEJ3_TRIV3|nr:hypothetical protein TVAGG3_0878160 [Trichomonas vaginalis G3]EAX96675.1 hypothetical protein TVAG_489570 [Trichomonas vaginalis G3]KAI5501840.1 hypothetical protein TVAGG3_0878160 [Trichomonas vaginalis G3]|eukprot:XP_001309605.1 hypothetical protein [Trichomonas vaginalis G3]
MIVPNEYVCPITGRTHTIVYKNQNKDKLINYCNSVIFNLNNHIKSSYFFTVDTEGKINEIELCDVFVLQFAECFANKKDFIRYKITGKRNETIDLQDGFIIIDPDDDVKKALRSVFTNYYVYTIFFDIVRDVLGLMKLGIPVNGLPDKNGVVKCHTVIDTQYRSNSGIPFFCSTLSLKDTINQIDFPCKQLAAAKEQLELKSSIDFPRLIYENQGKSNSEIVPIYIDLIPYISNDIALTALSLLAYIRENSPIIETHSTQAKQLTKLWKEDKQIRIKYGSAAFLKELHNSQHILDNPEKNLFSTYICAFKLHKYAYAIKKADDNYPFRSKDLVKFCKAAQSRIDGKKNVKFPSKQNVYENLVKKGLKKYNIHGELEKILLNEYEQHKDESEYQTKDVFKTLGQCLHPYFSEFLEYHFKRWPQFMNKRY